MPTDTRSERLKELESIVDRALGPRRRDRRWPLGLHDRATDVYLCRNGDGFLLYVGISLSVAQRLGSHRAQSWWSSVTHIEVEHYPSRMAALARETALIQDEGPSYNRAGRHTT